MKVEGYYDNSWTIYDPYEFMPVLSDYDDYIFEADWNTNGKKAGFIRNEDLFSFVGKRPNKGCILMWNGEDSITLHMIWLAYVYNISKCLLNKLYLRGLFCDPERKTDPSAH